VNLFRRHLLARRPVFLALAALALAVKVLVPPGFMAAPAESAANGFPLVLCTGHGALVLDAADASSTDRRKAPDQKPSHDGPCTFAGHSVAAPAPALAASGVVEFADYARAAPSATPSDLAPGRGLAAPPLPARGPPDTIV
jgi:hypothetical protein